MAKNKTNQAVNNNEVLNLEAAELNTELKATTEATAKQPNAVDEAQAELEALKAKMAEAKAKLAAAKKAATKSRPVRMSTFVVLVCQDKAAATVAVGEQMFKSDVHYCAEKAAIDVLAEDIKTGTPNEYVYAIVKRSKANEEDEKVVELLWIDAETNQIVIE